jgi:hypothetical protein
MSPPHFANHQREKETLEEMVFKFRRRKRNERIEKKEKRREMRENNVNKI